MERVQKLPSVFERARKAGVVLDFAMFDGAIGTEAEIVDAVPQVFARRSNFDAGRLRTLGSRVIWKRQFLGDWYDPENKALIKFGDWRTDDGRELHNPLLKTLDRVRFQSGGIEIPDAGTGGNFAYAFSSPPYSLQAKPSEIQAIFDSILTIILPTKVVAEIRDWSDARLPEVSDYFEHGMEWWGVFLFSIHLPALERLTIIAGSTTD